MMNSTVPILILGVLFLLTLDSVHGNMELYRGDDGIGRRPTPHAASSSSSSVSPVSTWKPISPLALDINQPKIVKAVYRLHVSSQKTSFSQLFLKKKVDSTHHLYDAVMDWKNSADADTTKTRTEKIRHFLREQEETKEKLMEFMKEQATIIKEQASIVKGHATIQTERMMEFMKENIDRFDREKVVEFVKNHAKYGFYALAAYTVLMVLLKCK